MMQRISVGGLTLWFGAQDLDSVELVRQACAKTERLLHEHWGLDTLEDCRVTIMTSWLGFMFRSAPWPWRLLLGVTLPLWALRAWRIWPIAGGWEQRFGRRRAVGVKPPRLLQRADRRIGERFFVERDNVDEKVQSITCHELTHAFTSHLDLPTWLREGLAMVTVDKFFQEPTVRDDTLEMLELPSETGDLGGRQRLRVGDEGALLEVYARGYWLTRYIEETQPGRLRDLLAERCPHSELERRIAAAYGKRRATFWDEIDEVLVSYFGQRSAAV
jgi:hypothetical protein